MKLIKWGASCTLRSSFSATFSRKGAIYIWLWSTTRQRISEPLDFSSVSISPEFSTIIERATAKEPELRPSASQLRAWLEGEQVPPAHTRSQESLYALGTAPALGNNSTSFGPRPNFGASQVAETESSAPSALTTSRADSSALSPATGAASEGRSVIPASAESLRGPQAGIEQFLQYDYATSRVRGRGLST
ncbi:MAG: hypothetical protein C4318_03605 [Acidimicrobiia bacterium]